MNRYRARPQRLGGPQHLWEHMRSLSARQGGFTLDEIYGLTNGPARPTIKCYLQHCLRNGFVLGSDDRPARNRNNMRVRRYWLAEGAPRLAPTMRRETYSGDRGRRAQQIWTAIRALKTFTVAELAATASTDDLQIKPSHVRHVVGCLAAVGYVVEIGRRTRVGQVAHWRLLPNANTGPLVPALRRDAVFDRNTGREIPIDGRAA